MVSLDDDYNPSLFALRHHDDQLYRNVRNLDDRSPMHTMTLRLISGRCDVVRSGNCRWTLFGHQIFGGFLVLVMYPQTVPFRYYSP